MTIVSHLTLVVSIFFALMGTIASFLFRTAYAPIYAKLAIMALIIASACAIYLTLPDILGYPLTATYEALPARVEVIAFLPYDDDKMVDLWLREENESPRAYSIPMTEGMKKTLRAAKQEQDANGRAMLVKAGKKRPNGVIDIDGGRAPYELDPNAFSLPAKGEGK